MQMRCKCDATIDGQRSKNASNLHRNEREIRCKSDANYDTNAMQMWVKMRCKCDANAMQMRCKCDANATQMRRKCDAIMKEKNSTIASNLHRNERKNTVQIRCKLQCKIDANMVAYERQIRCKYDANTMQIRYKYDATILWKSSTIASNLHRHEKKFGAKSMQITMQIRCKKNRKNKINKRCKFNSKTMQWDNQKRCNYFDANTMHIRCKYDATGRCKFDAKNLNNSMQIRCKFDV